jgi:ATP-dependent protease ClpP protease subunit
MNTLFRLHLDNLQRSKTPVAAADISNAADESTLYIYDMISADWGVNAKDVISAINAASGAKTLNIRINSPGGDVFEARAIIEAIKRFDGHVVAHIDALAASAATSIALAADEVVMSDGALFMIHNASGLAWGDKHEMRRTADLLEKVESAIVNDYTGKTGMEDTTIVAMMDAETWMTAQEALDNKFIDRIATKAAKPSNAWNLAAFAKAPAMPEPETTPEPVNDGTTDTNRNRLRLAQIV